MNVVVFPVFVWVAFLSSFIIFYLQEHSDFLQLMMNAHVNKPTAEDMADEELSQSIKFGDGDVWSTKGWFVVL